MSDATSSRQMIGTLVFLIFGPICWALQLTTVYGMQSALCAFQTVSTPTVSVLVVTLTAVIAGLAGAGLVRPGLVYRILTGVQPHSEQWPFLVFVMRSLTALSILAMAYSGTGALMLSSCCGLR